MSEITSFLSIIGFNLAEMSMETATNRSNMLSLRNFRVMIDVRERNMRQSVSN